MRINTVLYYYLLISQYKQGDKMERKEAGGRTEKQTKKKTRKKNAIKKLLQLVPQGNF